MGIHFGKFNIEFTGLSRGLLCAVSLWGLCVLCGKKISVNGIRKGADGAGLVDHQVHLGGEPAFVQKVIIDLVDHPVMNRPGATADGIFEAGLAEWNGRVEFPRELSGGLEGLMDALHTLEAFEVGKAERS